MTDDRVGMPMDMCDQEITESKVAAASSNSGVVTDAFLADLLSNSNHATNDSAQREHNDKIEECKIVSSILPAKEIGENNSEVRMERSEAATEQVKYFELVNNDNLDTENEINNETPEDIKYSIDNKGSRDSIEDDAQNSDQDKKVKKSNNEYRCNSSDSWSNDEDPSSPSSDSSSDSDTAFFNSMREGSAPKKFPVVKTKGELDLKDLPPIEDLSISVLEDETEKIGKIYAIVDRLVVIQALKDSRPLDLDTVLFLSHNKPLGRVFEVFGQVTEPFYTVRFNTPDHVNEKGVKVQADVFFAPGKKEITTYVFLETLKTKGSDASWKDNNEPPEQYLDYSDDEVEKNAKQKRADKNRNRDFSQVAAKRPSIRSSFDESPYIPPPHPPNRNVHGPSLQYSRNNPFNSSIPPTSPSPSLYSVGPSIRLQNSFNGSRSPFTYRFHSPQTQLPIQQQNVLQRPPQSPMLLPAFQQSMFGQVAVFNSVSPAFRSPSPFNSPVLSNIPTLVPANHLSPVAPQNYFNQRFSRSPSPALQTGPISPEPWLPNRYPVPLTSVPPNAPLSVQIPPSLNSPSLPVQPFEINSGPPQPFITQQNMDLSHQFVNQQNVNFQQPFVNHQNVNFSGGNFHPRF